MTNGKNEMKFALNYSPAAADLIRRGLIDIDLFKCPDWPEVKGKARSQRPTYTHFPLKAGHPDAPAPDTDHLTQQLEQTGTLHVNTHLDPQVDPGTSPRTCLSDVIELAIEQVAQLVDHFGPERVVVENVPYWQERDYHARLAAEPAFINRVVDETGCGFLLDLSHARIAAREMGIDEPTYIDALPTGRLREMHVTGLAKTDGWLRDHMPLRGDGWRMFGWAMERIRNGHWAPPRIVAFEYGGVGPRFEWRTDPDVLADQVPYLYGMVHARPPRSTMEPKAPAPQPAAV